jgi:cell division topological specificity factor
MSLIATFKRASSGKVARERLKHLLVSDRANCSPEMMNLIKTDMAHTVSKYFEIDKNQLEIQIITACDTQMVLRANIPIVEVRHD